MEVIYLDIDEEITSIIDRIRKAKVHDLVLVIPKRANLTQSIVNLKLLRKQISLIGKNVVVVAQEKLAYNLAKRAGLKVKSEVPSKGEVQKKKENDEPDLKKELTEKEEIAPEKKESLTLEEVKRESKKELKDDLPKIKSYLGEKEEKQEEKKDFRRKPQAQKKIVFLPKISVTVFAVFMAISMVIAGLIFFILLPKAEIKIFPKTEQYLTSLDVVVEKDVDKVDIENSVIPGEVIFVEETSAKKDFETEGIKDIGQKAKGDVIIYNKYSSSPQPLVASTRFLSNDGRVYRIGKDISVPGATIEGGTTIAGRIKVTIEADLDGEESNGANGTFIIPGLPPDKQEAIYAEAVTEISGGNKGEVRILSEEDLERAKNDLATKTYERSYQKLRSKAPKDKVFFENAAKKEIIETKSSQEVGDEVESFSLEIKVRISTLVFDSSDMEQIISAQIKKVLNTEKELVNVGIEDGIDAELSNFDFGTGKMGMKIKIEKKISYKVDVDNIAEEVKGHDEAWIKEYLLKDPNIVSAEVAFWPFWVKKAPRITKKIIVTLDNN